MVPDAPNKATRGLLKPYSSDSELAISSCFFQKIMNAVGLHAGHLVQIQQRTAASIVRQYVGAVNELVDLTKTHG